MNFVFDIDGTICFGNNKIPKDIYEEIKTLQEKGHRVIFATARSYRDSLPVIGEYFKNNIVVGLNGGYVYKDSKIELIHHINKSSFEKIMTNVIEEDLPYFVDEDFSYTCYKEEEFGFAPTIDPLKLTEKMNLNEINRPVKVVVGLTNYKNKEVFINMIKAIPNLDVMYHEREETLYINSYNITKATTILEVLNGENYIAYGNDKNDIDMFKNSSYSVQVGDLEYLKEYSSEIIRENQVAQSIREVLENINNTTK